MLKTSEDSNELPRSAKFSGKTIENLIRSLFQLTSIYPDASWDSEMADKPDKLLEAQKELDRLRRERQAFMAQSDKDIRAALQKVTEATEELLGGGQRERGPSPSEGPIKRRVVLFLGSVNRWATAEEIADETEVEVRQVEICLRNGKAKTETFDLDAGKWRLSAQGRELYNEIVSKT